MVRARKRFGQHFLEPAWVSKVVDAIGPGADDTFVEVGPGTGAITRPLAARAKAVVAYEIDRDLAARLKATAPTNVTVVEGDFLDVARIDSLRGARVAGNLPYNVAAPILFKLASLWADGAAWVDATVMLQREVADRLLAPPGTRDYGVLTVLMGHVASAERLLQLPRGAFRPAPQVLSSLVRLRFHAPVPPVGNTKVFARLVQAVFTRRRKTLANALQAFAAIGPAGDPPDASAAAARRSAAEALAAARLDPSRRPETLTIAEFAALAAVLG